MYRAGLEAILGFRVQGTSLLLTPCIPEKWPRFEIVFKYCSARYEILVENPLGVSRGITHAELDGRRCRRVRKRASHWWMTATPTACG